jgi:hypothetical protein
MKNLSHIPVIAISALLAAFLTGCGNSSSSSSSSTVTTAISGMVLDGSTSLYVANTDSSIVESLDPTVGSPTVSTVAGVAGQAGTAEGIPTASAGRFNNPVGITLLGSDLYVADTGNSGIRKLTAGVISNIAGNLGVAGNANGSGAAAMFSFPKGIASDGFDLYVADTFNHTIRKVDTSGMVTTVAGNGYFGTADGTGSAARFRYPYGIAVKPNCASAGTCDLFVADDANHAIRQVTTAGFVTTLAGDIGNSGSHNDTGTAATFNGPTGIVTDGTNLYVADTGNHMIRKIVIASKVVTTLAGTAGTAGNANGTGTGATFNSPTGLALDTTSGVLYVSDQNHTKIRKIVISSGVVTTLSASF